VEFIRDAPPRFMVDPVRGVHKFGEEPQFIVRRVSSKALCSVPAPRNWQIGRE